jgi:hypothetical protein
MILPAPAFLLEPPLRCRSRPFLLLSLPLVPGLIISPALLRRPALLYGPLPGLLRPRLVVPTPLFRRLPILLGPLLLPLVRLFLLLLPPLVKVPLALLRRPPVLLGPLPLPLVRRLPLLPLVLVKLVLALLRRPPFLPLAGVVLIVGPHRGGRCDEGQQGRQGGAHNHSAGGVQHGSSLFGRRKGVGVRMRREGSA